MPQYPPWCQALSVPLCWACEELVQDPLQNFYPIVQNSKSVHGSIVRGDNCIFSHQNMCKLNFEGHSDYHCILCTVYDFWGNIIETGIKFKMQWNLLFPIILAVLVYVDVQVNIVQYCITGNLHGRKHSQFSHFTGHSWTFSRSFSFCMKTD